MVYSSIISTEDRSKIMESFTTMSDSPGSESLDISKLSQNLQMSLSTDVKDILTSAENGSKLWKSYSFKEKCNRLKQVAQGIEKNADLLAQAESSSSLKHIHRTKTFDIPNLIQSFYYNAAIVEANDVSPDSASGVVCVMDHGYNSPMPSICWKIAPILAAGYSVVLFKPKETSSSALVMAELCSQNGLPPGLFNVAPIFEGNFPELPSSVVKVICTGEYQDCAKGATRVARQGIPCEIFIPKQSTFIVYDTADLYSAVSGVIESLIFSHTMTVKGGCKVYVQTSIEKKFHRLLEEQLKRLSIGPVTSKTDMSCFVTKEQHSLLTEVIEKARKQQFQIFEGPEKDSDFWTFKPTVICNVPTTSNLQLEDIGGPVIVTVPFRTAKESIEMFNHTKQGSEVSIWTEKLSLGLEVAYKLTTRTVWLNTQNIFDASVTYGGLGLSGSSIDGGKEGFITHWNITQHEETSNTASEKNTSSENVVYAKDVPAIGYAYNLYISGSYKKPSVGTYKIKTYGDEKPLVCIADGSSADLQNAISSALAMQSKWQNLGKNKLIQILRKIAESLLKNEREFVAMLADTTGKSKSSCEEEVSESVARIEFWATHATYIHDQVTQIEGPISVLQVRSALGVIGIQMPDESPLLSFVSFVIPAIVLGNAVVAIASEKYPVPALKMCQLFQSCGVLDGIVNVITGCRSELTPTLVTSSQLDAVWFGEKEILPCDEPSLADSVMFKRIFHCRGIWNVSTCTSAQKITSESTFLKAIFMPIGNIFAN